MKQLLNDVERATEESASKRRNGEPFAFAVTQAVGANPVANGAASRLEAPLFDAQAESGSCGPQLQAAREEARVAHDEMNALIGALGDVVLVVNGEGRYVKAFRSRSDLLFVPPEQLIGRLISDILPPGQTEICMDAVKRALQTGEVQHVKYELPFPDEHKHFDGRASPLPDGNVVFVARDCTDSHYANARLRKAEERYRSLFEHAVEGIFQTTPEGRYLGANPALARIYGYESADDLIHSLTNIERQLYVDPKRRDEFKKLIESEGIVDNFESQVYRKDGGVIWVSENARVVRNENGDITGYEGFIEDVTARREAEERLRYNALHDRLTGLPNRALFMDRLGQTMARSRRNFWPDNFYAVLFLDMDRFKIVNDSMGHMAGDTLLIEMARRLEHCLRPGDTVARLGGDEFAVLLDGLTSPEQTQQIAERVQETLSHAFELGGQSVSTSASIGIAIGDARYEKPEELLRDADMAMYRAKMGGKARHETFDAEMHARAVAMMRLESDLRLALERDEFRLFYQPIVTLPDERLSGFEALLRWEHPERGMVPPGEFIPLAEESGLIVQIGLWALREACTQMKRWHDAMPNGALLPTVSVNLSVKQFSQPDLGGQIERVLQEVKLDPCYLKLEITESALMGNAENIGALLIRLRNLGVRLGLDDFGTGYSSLSYLHRFPLDTLKIDRSFISGMEREARHHEIVRAIVTLAKNLGMDVVAEGVETGGQLQRLRELSCQHAQGYFFSRPTNSEDAHRMLLEANIA